ncbi:MAG: Uma2 family endonuclease [Rhodoferax sp.]
MAHPQPKTLFTPDSYLDWEVLQPDKHEYIRGEVYAMAGGEDRHQTAALNTAVLLRQHLGGTPCRVYMSDVRVQTEEAYFYPDVFVTCSARDAQDRLVKREPTLVVEVLSPSTAAFDTGAKFAHYRSVASLREYVLVDLDRRSVDVFRKSAEGLWVLHPHTEADTLELTSVELRCPASAVFADLEDGAPPAA